MEKLSYLDGVRENNIEIINKRVREINEDKQKNENHYTLSNKIFK